MTDTFVFVSINLRARIFRKIFPAYFDLTLISLYPVYYIEF